MTSVFVIDMVEQLSVADAVPVFAGSVLAVHWIVTFGGQVITGDALSSTMIV
jgi:acyl-CoA thioesterase